MTSTEVIIVQNFTIELLSEVKRLVVLISDAVLEISKAKQKR